MPPLLPHWVMWYLFMLPQSRVVYQSQGERNYHIFYQILGGASKDVLGEQHCHSRSSLLLVTAPRHCSSSLLLVTAPHHYSSSLLLVTTPRHCSLSLLVTAPCHSLSLLLVTAPCHCSLSLLVTAPCHSLSLLLVTASCHSSLLLLPHFRHVAFNPGTLRLPLPQPEWFDICTHYR